MSSLVLSHMVSNLSFMLPIVTNWFYIHTNTCYFIIRDHSDKSHKYKVHNCTRYLINYSKYGNSFIGRIYE